MFCLPPESHDRHHIEPPGSGVWTWSGHRSHSQGSAGSAARTTHSLRQKKTTDKLRFVPTVMTLKTLWRLDLTSTQQQMSSSPPAGLEDHGVTSTLHHRLQLLPALLGGGAEPPTCGLHLSLSLDCSEETNRFTLRLRQRVLDHGDTPDGGHDDDLFTFLHDAEKSWWFDVPLRTSVWFKKLWNNIYRQKKTNNWISTVHN